MPGSQIASILVLVLPFEIEQVYLKRDGDGLDLV